MANTKATSGSFKKNDPRINRKGRPKLGQSLADKFQDAMKEAMQKGGNYTVLDSMIDTLIKKALKGDQDALEYCLARGWGKLIDRVESVNLNKNYDFSNLSQDERLKLLELLKRAEHGTIVPSDNPDTH